MVVNDVRSDAGVVMMDMMHETTAPIRNDFHLSLLWLRSMEINTGRSLMLDDDEVIDLFRSYRSPWRA